VKLTPTKIAGCFMLDVQPHVDDRGSFTRTWCAEELQANGLNPCVAQCSVSFNHHRGTLRGMHHQAAPNEEAKVVRCTRGRIFDVVLDLRPESPTYRTWLGIELDWENQRSLYIPEGCAHGYQSLTDTTEVYYMISVPFHPESARCCRWNDPVFSIQWPLPEIARLSTRDATAPDFVVTPPTQ